MSVDYRTAAERLSQWLPQGECWTAGSDGFSLALEQLLLGLGREPARLYDACDAFLADFMPDTSEDFLADWERLLRLSSTGLSTSQRQNQIIAKLQGASDPTRENLEARLQALDPDAKVMHRLWAAPQAGLATTAAPIDTAQAVVTIEYMDTLLTADPDAWQSVGTFSGGAGFGTGSTARYTGTCTNLAFSLAGGTLTFSLALSQAPQYFSAWCRASALGKSAKFEYRSAQIGSPWTQFSSGEISRSWGKVIVLIPASDGTDHAQIRITNTSGAGWNMPLSQVVAGARDLPFEKRAEPLVLVPEHALIEWAAISEYP